MSKHRARVSAAEYTQMGGRRVKTKAAHGYTPQNLKEYEDKIGWLLRQARVERNDVDDLGVHAVFYVRGVKLDVDNLVKALLDGCNHVAWRDDQQVTRLTAEAVRGSDEPHIDLVVYVTGRRARDCENCGKPLTASQIARGRMFCSKGCYDRDQRRGTNRPCATCGTIVYRNAEKAQEENVYCSPECRTTAPGICRECGKQSVEQWTNRHFCSTECSVSWHKRRALSPKSKPCGTCADCGGPVFGRGSERCKACSIAHRAPKGRPPKRTGASYDACPDCGGRKRTTSQRCIDCRWKPRELTAPGTEAASDQARAPGNLPHAGRAGEPAVPGDLRVTRDAGWRVVNLTGMPPGHYVGCSLPDGRVAIADAENPAHASVVAAIRRRDYATWPRGWTDRATARGAAVHLGACHITSPAFAPTSGGCTTRTPQETGPEAVTSPGAGAAGSAPGRDQ